MARLFINIWPFIYNNKNFPNSIQMLSKKVQSFAKYKKTLRKIAKHF